MCTASRCNTCSRSQYHLNLFQPLSGYHIAGGGLPVLVLGYLSRHELRWLRGRRFLRVPAAALGTVLLPRLTLTRYSLRACSLPQSDLLELSDSDLIILGPCKLYVPAHLAHMPAACPSCLTHLVILRTCKLVPAQELARMVLKMMNLQDALATPRGPPSSLLLHHGSHHIFLPAML